MSGSRCAGCLGSGRCWVCLGTGFRFPERRLGMCSRCKGLRHCDLCDAPFLITDELSVEPLLSTVDAPRRVLVIDDEPAMLSLVNIWLTDDPRCGSVVTTSTADRAFVSLAEESPPDTIICDFHIGAISSDSYLPGFRSAAPHARIVIYTCDPVSANRADVTAQGADVVIDKVQVPLEQLVDIALSGPIAA